MSIRMLTQPALQRSFYEKTHLSRPVEDAAGGEAIIIAKAGKSIARLRTLETSKPRCKLGILEGKLRLPEDIDAPVPEDVAASFEEC